MDIDKLVDLSKRATPGELKDGRGFYPSTRKITGLSFQIKYVTGATNLTVKQGLQRQLDAELIVYLWNHRETLLNFVRKIGPETGNRSVKNVRFPKSVPLNKS